MKEMLKGVMWTGTPESVLLLEWVLVGEQEDYILPTLMMIDDLELVLGMHTLEYLNYYRQGR